MTRHLDTIKFESRREVETLMDVISKYVEQTPEAKKNDTLRQFYDLLDIIDLEW